MWWALRGARQSWHEIEYKKPWYCNSSIHFVVKKVENRTGSALWWKRPVELNWIHFSLKRQTNLLNWGDLCWETYGSLMGREVFQDKCYNLIRSCSGGGNGSAGDLDGRHPGRLQRVLGSHGFPPSQNHYPQVFCHQWIGSLLAVCHQSVQAPLFPIEASGKGATGSQISPGIMNEEWPNVSQPVLGTMYPGLFFTSFLVPILVSR